MPKQITHKRKPLSKIYRGSSITPGKKLSARITKYRGYEIWHIPNSKSWTIFRPRGTKSSLDAAHKSSLDAAKKAIDDELRNK